MSSLSNRSSKRRKSSLAVCLNFLNMCHPLRVLLIVICCPWANVAHTLESLNIPPPPLTTALALPGASSILEDFIPTCTAVAHIFQSRGIDPSEIPPNPSNEMSLRYCESPAAGTCCTHTMEIKMALQSRLQLEKHSKEQILKMSRTLSDKAQKFNGHFRRLLQESKMEFNNMFTRTYGVIYQQNAYVFSDLFNEFENYYNHERVDLLEVMNIFFNNLYQKMFQVLNAQYSFDENYLRCVSEHMDELKPFGDIPRKLSVQIKKSFVATRTYGQALSAAADISKRLVNVRLNADCTSALIKMQHCGSCKGYGEKPCTNYCVNVIKGCLHYFHELNTEWENYALAMDKLAERLLGSFNIVMVVEPINIKISEAIMNFQDAGYDITNRVFQGCGRPTLGRLKRNISPKFLSSTTPIEQLESDILDIDASLDSALLLREKRVAYPNSHDSDEDSNGDESDDDANNRRHRPPNRQYEDNEDTDYKGRDPALDKLVNDVRQRIKDYKKFWSNLPFHICSNANISSSSDADGMCWNGHTIDRYMHSVTNEHSFNPEFPGNPATPKQTSQVATQVFYLKNAINHLRNAYNGQDVHWSEQEEPYYGSGSGSGGGVDDEDDEDGSGLGSPFIFSHKPHGKPVDDEDDEERINIGIQTNTFWPHRPHDTNVVDNDDGDSHDDDEDLQSRGSTIPEKMSLRRALFMYLMPLYMTWFGGITVDLL